MRIGFIGAGRVTQVMGRHLLNAGHTIAVCNSRGPETLAGLVKELGPGATAETKAQVVESDVVVVSVRWVHAEEALQGVDWTGRILVDAMNAHAEHEGDVSLAGVTKSRAVLAETGSTSSELVAGWAPGARLVKSISNIPMEWIEDFGADRPRTVLFASGDDAEAKHLVMKMLDGAGFATVDLGSLAVGGAMHEVGAPLSGLELHLIRRMRP
ncbi:NADP oxidoreductase [Streptomyces sp. CB09001]|uniref:NADPH-dependent F420 reductase n=1 Tax=Streptomyces sp. CB09001 TaxID=2083284 RepID=UPI000E213AF9|nr:NAD(P)-binding domain-containing protein [Streptomyces sp. CB09001]AXL92878.1 NADP oxidoreductase [Streptomyces sp. CB09001]